MTASVREARFAGSWYPGEPAALEAVILDHLGSGSPTPGIVGVMAPHAGLIHSGPIAGQAFAAAGPRRGAVVLAPNHRDRRAQRPAFAFAPESCWRTPLGDLTMDAEGAAELVARAQAAGLDAALDGEAHDAEHAIELELPFLQVQNPEVAIIAVSVATHDPDRLARFGELLGDWVAERWGEAGLVVASSDMTHYQPPEVVSARDAMALERVLNFDGPGLLSLCKREHISMCGRAPTAAMIAASRRCGAIRSEVLGRGTSRSVDGQPEGPVVGYAAVAMSR